MNKALYVFMVFLIVLPFAKADCHGTNFNFTCGEIINESCTISSPTIMTGNCFIVGTDNITITGGDYYVGEDITGYGFLLQGRTNVTFDNVQIYYPYVGYLLNNSNNIKINGGWVYVFDKAAVFMINSSYNNITNLQTHNYGSEHYHGYDHCNYATNYDRSGIAICDYSSNNYVSGFSIDYGAGIDAAVAIRNYCNKNTIYNVNVNNTDTYGIMIFNMSHNTNISNFFLYAGRSTNDGIIQSANIQNTTLANSYFENTTEWGPFVDSSINLHIKNITVKNAQWICIRLTTNSTNALIEDSYLENCSNYGIYLAKAINNTFEDNIIKTSGTGFYFANGGVNNNLIKNTISSSSAYGIYSLSSNDLFLNNTNELGYSGLTQKIYFDKAQNISSLFNMGWFPLLQSNGSDATIQNNTAWYNGMDPGRNSDGSINYAISYWYNQSIYDFNVPEFGDFSFILAIACVLGMFVYIKRKD